MFLYKQSTFHKDGRHSPGLYPFLLLRLLSTLALTFLRDTGADWGRLGDRDKRLFPAEDVPLLIRDMEDLRDALRAGDKARFLVSLC